MRAPLRLKFTNCEIASCDSNGLRIYARLLHAAKFHPATCSEQIVPEFGLGGTGGPIRFRDLALHCTSPRENQYCPNYTHIASRHEFKMECARLRRRKQSNGESSYAVLSPPGWLTPQVDHGSYGSSRPWPEVKNIHYSTGTPMRLDSQQFPRRDCDLESWNDPRRSVVAFDNSCRRRLKGRLKGRLKRRRGGVISPAISKAIDPNLDWNQG